jgi:hypothetical protein
MSSVHVKLLHLSLCQTRKDDDLSPIYGLRLFKSFTCYKLQAFKAPHTATDKHLILDTNDSRCIHCKLFILYLNY